MAMSVGPSAEGEETPMSDINTTPLVDVMLVLLIIFLITVPITLQSVPVQLPKVEYEPTVTKPENVNLSVRAVNGQCEVYWELTKINSEQLLDRAVADLEAQIEAAGGAENLTDETLPEAHIRSDINTPWRCVGGAIAVMLRAGYPRGGFLSEPEPRGGTRY